MNRILVSFCLALCAAAFMVWVARPSEAGAVQEFSLRSLRGEFVYALDGFTIQGESGNQPFAWAGKEIYDGAGHVAGVFTASYNGQVVRRTYTGTYTVNPDGSGSTTLTDSNGEVSHFDIFIQEGGREVSYVATDPGVVSAGYERSRK
jgi:hypothetical protein